MKWSMLITSFVFYVQFAL